MHPHVIRLEETTFKTFQLIMFEIELLTRVFCNLHIEFYVVFKIVISILIPQDTKLIISCPLHWLLCHLGLYDFEFNFLELGTYTWAFLIGDRQNSTTSPTCPGPSA
jgi:hypothetical protein